MDFKYLNVPCDVEFDKVLLDTVSLLSLLLHLVFFDSVPVTPVYPASTPLNNGLFRLVNVLSYSFNKDELETSQIRRAIIYQGPGLVEIKMFLR